MLCVVCCVCVHVCVLMFVMFVWWFDAMWWVDDGWWLTATERQTLYPQGAHGSFCNLQLSESNPFCRWMNHCSVLLGLPLGCPRLLGRFFMQILNFLCLTLTDPATRAPEERDGLRTA